MFQLVTEIRNVALWFVEWFPIFCFIRASRYPDRQQKQLLAHFTDGQTAYRGK